MPITSKAMKTKQRLYKQRKARVNAKTKQTLYDVRVLVHKSNTTLSAQALDSLGKVIAVIEDRKSDGATKTERAASAGKAFAEQLSDYKDKKVVFDRNGYLYHGRVKAFADGMREGGIAF